VTISNKGDLTVPDLEALGLTRWSYAIGAQGTKYWASRRALPGVYTAKDLVITTTVCRPSANRPFPIGRRVAIVGIGNVMVDIANYCAHFTDCDEISRSRARPVREGVRRPRVRDVEEPSTTRSTREIERIGPTVAAGQNPDELLAALAAKPRGRRTRARLRFRFLASPRRVLAEGGR